MLAKDNRYKVLSVFFENPLPKGIGFQLREISRKIQLAPKSVKRYLKELKEERLIKIKKHRIQGYPVYYANRDDEYFKFLKKRDTITKITESNLIKYIDEKYSPDVIILFGSAALGEDLKNSDVDIFVLGKKRKLNLNKYEEILKRKINIFFCNNFKKLSKELKNNIINGVILKGYLKVF